MLALLIALAAADAPGASGAADSGSSQPTQPNILWITSEDNGPQLGCYGDEYAVTPNLDALAARSLRYDRCWSNAPVCAPARTTLITGLYPPSFGGEHMRSRVDLPESIKLYPALLAGAGYYCTNPGKTDYNVPGESRVWQTEPADGQKFDGRKPDYMGRAAGQPFFHVQNFTISHESKIRDDLGRPLEHDPADAPVPAYHPDVPEVRRDWAQYYDRLTMMDEQVGQELAKLERNGLADSTIVMYYGDHGSGMPRSKRQPYDSGLRVPLIVHIPERYAHLRPDDYAAGGSSDRLVGFVDMAPTLLSLAGAAIPDVMQGVAFLGEQTADKPYLYGFRGRMDERYDCMRSVTDGRYVYLRNYLPQRPYGQYIGYMFQTPTTAIWKQLFEDGQLNDERSRFWQPKPLEELYDLQSDPDEVTNLVDSPEHQTKLAELSHALTAWQTAIVDIGMMPEGLMHRRCESLGITPYELARTKGQYSITNVLDAATLPHRMAAAARAGADSEQLQTMLADGTQYPGPVAQFWSTMAMLQERRLDGLDVTDGLQAALGNDSLYVRLAAAEAVLCYGPPELIEPAQDVVRAVIESPRSTGYDLMWVGNIIEQAGDDGRASVSPIDADVSALAEAYRSRELPKPNPAKRPKWGEYITRVKEKLAL